LTLWQHCDILTRVNLPQSKALKPKENFMRILIALGIVVAASCLTSPRAEAATWCYDGEHGVTCGFVSLQQCLESVSGNDAGTCVVDSMPATQEVVRKQPRKRAAN
jgi:hypothetical protein